MTRSYKRRNRKTRRQFRKIQKGGGLIAMYEEPVVTQDTEYRNNTTRGFVNGVLHKCLYGSAPYYFASGPSALYLNGYDNFIGPNKLLPIYYNNTKRERMADRFGVPKPVDVKQVFYYISQFVYDCCILTNGGNGGSGEFDGYKGVEPVFTPVKNGTYYVNYMNLGKPYGDKYMVFPTYQVGGLPNYGRITYTFTPTRETNIYEVPGVGEVIMNDPENGEPWFDEIVTVVFDPGFIPPKINRENTIDDDVGISHGAFAAVGEEMATR